MGWKVWMKDYLTFTRKDRIGMVVIALILAGILFLPALIFTESSQPVSITDTAWMSALTMLDKNEEPEERKPRYQPRIYSGKDWKTGTPLTPAGTLFAFDPNTLERDDLLKLGLRPKTSDIILNYRLKGGKFRQASDLQRVYGLSEEEYRRLLPYIKIPSTTTPSSREFAVRPEAVAEISSPKSYRPAVVDLNTADTAALIRLPAIGAKLSLRIVSFREKLGGFYSIEQLKEVYGITDSAFQAIRSFLRLGENVLRKININAATAEDLKAHPYIRYVLAAPIVSYRKEHGDFKRLEELKNIMAITPEVYAKLQPYLSL